MPLLKGQEPEPDEAHSGQYGYPRQVGLTVTRKVSVELTCPAQEPLAPRHVCSEPEVGLRGGVPEADSGVKWDCGP